MPSAMPSFLHSLGSIILASLLISSISFQRATARHLLQENSSSDPEPKHELQESSSSNPMLKYKLAASSSLSSDLYEPTMLRTLPSFQRRPMFPPRLLPVLPFPSKPTLPTIPSFPVGPGGDIGNVPDTSTSTPSAPPPPSWLSSENSPSGKQQQQHDHDTQSDKKYDSDKMAPEFPQP